MLDNFFNGKRPAGVADTIDITQYDSIVEVLDKACKDNAERPAFTNLGYTLSFADLDRLSADFAAYLEHETDLQPGDRVAVQMPNLLQFPVAVFGAMRAGMVVVNTNPLYTTREMKHQFNDSGAKALIVVDMFGHMVEEILAETPLEHVIVTSIGDMVPGLKGHVITGLMKYVKKMVPPYNLPKAVKWRQALSSAAGKGYTPRPATREDLAILQYTGGTTGVAKGAMLTNKNILANMLQVKAALHQKNDKGQPIFGRGTETVVAPLPLYHIYSFTVHCMCMLEMGNHSILITNPRDPKMFIKMIKDRAITGFIGLNTLFVSLMDHPDFKLIDFSKLSMTLSGGTALVKDTSLRWREATGITISEAYGLTECSPAVCVNPLGEQAQIGTIGLPLPGTDLKCIDADGSEVALGERGELCVRGDQVMKGYWQRPDATAEVLSEDGWLRTGDVAVIAEDGFVKIVDRIKDLILVSGFNVYPNEIEDVVSSHPDVVNCAVIGVADEKSGEAPKLFVVTHNTALKKEQLMDYCREHLTGYKLPRYIEFRDELPMTPVGKILRRELRDSDAA
ncbi:long-chain acyl-CoA synthetase [Sinobacterium caligoides]|uniref:Long-chain-fatty-acid--CoA ligase n=1 Tax=Sinobacterium caligoides TaxID=933926 RepID=A0A3N2DG39_9GAMM|nr:AMP-binding protein [Sinobacterium caligoides]ROR98699.1 long-chain acyl-CoA synthetase [Sinobacterium caligoides]